MGALRPFKSSAQSYTGLELQPHTLSQHIIFRGHIRAPATLPNFVHMHVMNSSL